jgi:DNA polymerase III subunit chi
VQVDFYQLSRDPAEAVVPLLARNTLKAGERLLVVSADDDLTGRISERLWAGAESFLAHGLSGGAHDARQPILLADQPQPANGARYVILADGVWHEAALGFARAFLLFDGSTIEAARATWRALDGREGVERRYWRQEENGKWVQAA